MYWVEEEITGHRRTSPWICGSFLKNSFKIFKWFFWNISSLQEHQKKHSGKDDGLGGKGKDSRSWPYSSRASRTRQFGILHSSRLQRRSALNWWLDNHNLMTKTFSTKSFLFLRLARPGLWWRHFWQGTWTSRSVRERICQGFAASRFPRTWIKNCPANCDHQSLEWDAKTGDEDLGT